MEGIRMKEEDFRFHTLLFVDYKNNPYRIIYPFMTDIANIQNQISTSNLPKISQL